MRIQAAIVFAFAFALAIFGVHSPSLAGDLSNPASLDEKAPDVYKVKFDTSKGSFVVEVHRDWAPNGADRFYNLVKNGFYNDARFFRVISDFMVQFGINGNPKISQVWQDANIPDDPVKQSNIRGMITFATAGPIHAPRKCSSISAITQRSTARAFPRSAK
jgi:peptidyl-prolyl cis-trans isomerase A (cyclophilin A)